MADIFSTIGVGYTELGNRLDVKLHLITPTASLEQLRTFPDEFTVTL
jgi:hypothetical protein